MSAVVGSGARFSGASTRDAAWEIAEPGSATASARRVQGLMTGTLAARPDCVEMTYPSITARPTHTSVSCDASLDVAPAPCAESARICLRKAAGPAPSDSIASARRASSSLTANPALIVLGSTPTRSNSSSNCANRSVCDICPLGKPMAT